MRRGGGGDRGRRSFDDSMETDDFHSGNTTSRKIGGMDGISTTEAIFHLVNGILGVGVLGYPFAFKECGIMLGTVIVIGILAACLFSVRILLISSQLSGKRTYEDLAAYTYGKWGQSLIKLAILILNLGALVAYLNIMADVLSSVAGTVIPPGAEPSRNSVIVGVTLVGILPIAMFIQDASSLAWVSSFTVGYIFIFAMLMLLWGVTPLSAQDHTVLYWEPKGVLVAFPVMAYGFTVHTILFPVYAFLRAPTSKRMSRAVSRAMILCSVVYFSVGLGGYMAFGKRASGDILRNLGAVELVGLRGTYERVVKLGYGLNILGTVPLVILPMQSILLPMMGNCMKSIEAQQWSTAFEKRFISAAVIVLAVGMAMVLPNVEFILGLNGAINGVLLSYIMPSLIYLRIADRSLDLQPKPSENESKEILWRKRKAVALLIFGIFAGIFCTMATLKAVDRENTMVEFARNLLMRNKHVEDASAAVQKAEDTVLTVNALQNATRDIGGAQNNTVASLATIQKSAAALDAAVSTPNPPLENVPIWDIGTRVNVWKKQEDDAKAFRLAVTNLKAVRENLGKTLEAVEAIKESLAATAEQVQGTNSTSTDSDQEGDATISPDLVDLTEQLGQALGISIKPEEHPDGKMTLAILQREVESSKTALVECLTILDDVEKVIEHALEKGIDDAELRKQATEAMERAVKATASSALALRLTDDALHEAAHNQTSALLDVLTSVVDKEVPVDAQLSFLDLDTSGSEGSAGTVGNALTSRPFGQFGNNSATAEESPVEMDEHKTNAESVLQQISEIKNKTITPPGDPSTKVNVTALAEAAQATLEVVGGTKQEAIEKQKEAVSVDVNPDGQLDPDLVDKAQEIAKDLTTQANTNKDADVEDENDN